MNIKKEDIDALNAVVKIDIVAEDYQAKVATLLADHRKKANVPGFRKGQVPMGMIKKQHGKSILMEEVNKLLQESLNTFLAEEKLDLLGNPLPRVQEDFNWDSETLSFEFELGLVPKFDVDLKSKKKVTEYNIIAPEDLLDE
jgi:trigger factor